ncbi:hypothetical protein KP509_12G001700 [Ceratopteris richardii]|uniref:ACT domain-containing protein n=1 Tax=Ceratopteris richardii TaxID=49495 RepID=A0A8T2TIE9_CERRI|nr:hypothetical protein KP509_12G001700 [Ceratopteris richardii]
MKREDFDSLDIIVAPQQQLRMIMKRIRSIPITYAAGLHGDFEVAIDNHSCGKCTLVMVDSANKHGILLEVVQVLTELDLTIWKAYISSDGGWFMDVFHVTDQHGHKLTDEHMVDFIERSLGAKRAIATLEVQTCLGRTVGVQSIAEHTVIELTGADRPGLLSEISAVLTNLRCNIVAAQLWTHNRRVACVLYVVDEFTGGPVEDMQRLCAIKEQFCNILRSSDDNKAPKVDFSMGLTHTERRLHQMLFADRDYEGSSPHSSISYRDRPEISIKNCADKGYSMVNICSRGRPKLFFDTVCTLTDMQYVVFHATMDSEGPFSMQVYYIRHMDGCTLDTEGERQRVTKCLEAAINRRVSQGIRLELYTTDRVGLLSDVTRVFHENGLSVERADVTTQGTKAVNTFYVSNASGGPIEMEVLQATQNEIGQQVLNVKGCPDFQTRYATDVLQKKSFSFGNLIKSQWEWFSSNLGLV